MYLSARDSQRLRDAGFIGEEIERFGMAVTPTGRRQPQIDLNSPAWQATMAARMRQRDRLARKGLDEKQQDAVYQQYYQARGRAKRSPYDFLKSAYIDPKGLTDYGAVIRRRLNNRKNKGISRAVRYVIENSRKDTK